MSEDNLLGDYLRARRELVQPDTVDLPVNSDVDDPGFVQLVGELSLSSEQFRRLWARHDVHSFEGTPVRINHPQVGELTLSREKLAIGDPDGQLLVIYHAKPGASSFEKLALLASLASPTVTTTNDAVPRPFRTIEVDASPVSLANVEAGPSISSEES